MWARRREWCGARSEQEACGVDPGGFEARAERTRNMCVMDVTPEVLQPEMSALKLLMSLKSSAMSVMEETPQ